MVPNIARTSLLLLDTKTTWLAISSSGRLFYYSDSTQVWKLLSMIHKKSVANPFFFVT